VGKAPNQQREAAWLLAASFLICLVIGLFRYPIVRWAGEGLGFVLGTFILFLIAAGVFSVVVSKGWKRKTVSLVIAFSSLFVFAWRPLENHFRAEDIATNRGIRERIVAELADGLHKPDERGRFHVPKSAASAQAWLVENEGGRWVFFPLQPFGIDNYAGVVHSASGEPPPRVSFFEVVWVERIDDHWFWIATT
jgi:hypothetical protein